MKRRTLSMLGRLFNRSNHGLVAILVFLLGLIAQIHAGPNPVTPPIVQGDTLVIVMRPGEVLIFVRKLGVSASPQDKGMWHDATGNIFAQHRYYQPGLGSFTQMDPARAGSNWYAYCGSEPVNRADPTGLAFYAFDGTANHFQNPADHGGTNVHALYKLVVESSAYHKHYFGGPGNPVEYGPLDSPLHPSQWNETFGQGAGWGSDVILAHAMAWFKADVKAGDKQVDVVGFSRGAANALEFLHQVEAYTRENNISGISINFVGLFDTVGSYGVHTDPDARVVDHGGYRLSLTTGDFAPKHAFHYVALDEQRREFQVIDVQGAIQEGFVGNHADIGGGYANKGLSNITLHRMIDAAHESGVPIIRNRWLGDYQRSNSSMPPHREMSASAYGFMNYTYTPAPRVLPKGTIIPEGYTGPPKLNGVKVGSSVIYTYADDKYTKE